MSKAVISLDQRQLVLQQRQRLMSEHVFDLVRNNNDIAEIRAATTPAIKREAMACIPFVELDLRPCNVDDTKGKAPIFDMISAYVALALATAPRENREEFISTAVVFLGKHPESLVIPTIEAICEERVWPAEFVSTVIERITDKAAKLRQELAAYQKIVSLDEGGEA